MTDPLWTSDDRHLVHYLMMGNGTTNKVFYGYGNIEDYEAFWTDMSGSSSGGMEKLSNWDETSLASSKMVMGGGVPVTIPLIREIKATDILMVTWIKMGAYGKDSHCLGSAIFSPQMVDQDSTFDVALEQIENWSDNSNFYGLFVNNQSPLVGQIDFPLFQESGGDAPAQCVYAITAVYNISGK